MADSHIKYVRYVVLRHNISHIKYVHYIVLPHNIVILKYRHLEKYTMADR